MKELVSRKGFLKCGVAGCAESVYFKEGNEYFCRPHGEEMEAARDLESTIKSYTQSIYAAAVAKEAGDMRLHNVEESEIRDYFRGVRRASRLAAEILFEDAGKP